ncbi:TPA: hypothetical protein SL812_003327 [Pseudomonas aeruginosa]|nr:hypothetical protein [Pseudomonas aeruginosa]
MSAGGEIPRPVRKNKNDFSDALGDRRIEEVNTPWFAGASTNTSPRAREESMPTLFEFAAMWGILLLTMFLPIRLKRRPIQPQDA